MLRAWGEQGPQFAKLLVDRVVAREPRGAFEPRYEGVKRTVLVARRAEIAQAGLRLISQSLDN